MKVAALYHDIGKMLKPMYFIENQPIAPDGKPTFNPHNNLSHDDSAKVIIEHVTEGARMAERHNLPRIIIDFIWTHHGTTFVEYFYRLHLRTHEASEEDKKIFQYPGPTPRTKEETILMLADSLEAASKSLRNPDAQAIDDLVDKIVQGKIDQKQLHHSALSFQDLELCKRSFKQTLKNIHHLRIEYPSDARQKRDTS
ncbi:MAG: HDIG domain-containing protein [Saprospiraceae bacterium]|nr:HDIG domain-containing protein [Saprospiraceae bacterium]